MKRLMTALAAVAGAIGLQAAAFTDSGTSFEPAEAPTEASTTPFTAAVTQGELQSGTYWNLPTAAEDVEVNLVVDTQNKSVTGKGAVKEFSSATHYATLSLSTGKNAEVERYAADGGTVVNLGGESSGVDGTSLHFDSLVKFTAFDQDKTPAEVLGDDGKIAIWVRENLDDNGEPVSTNLIVTAGYVNESYELTPTNYVCTYSVPDSATLCDWHRVTVKAMRTIVDGDIYPGFAIAIDGNVIGTDADDKGFGNFPAGISLTNIASGFDEIGGVFPSVQKGSANANVKSVAFKGIGEVDDLVFTEEPPITEFAESGNVMIRGDANVTGFTYQIGDGTPVPIYVNSATIPFGDVDGETVTISGVTCKSGYVYGNLTAQGATISGDAASEIADMAVITINTTLGGATVNGQTFATAAEAFDAINNSSDSDFTVTLMQNAFESITLDNASATVVLDLAGNNITGDDDAAAITLESGTLVVTNSTTAIGHVISADKESYEAVVVNDGDLTIGGGIYDGPVVAENAGTFIITGGSFDADSVEGFGTLTDMQSAVEAGLGEGYSLVDNGEGYYVIVNATVEYEVTYVLDLDGATNAVDNITNYTSQTAEFTLLPAGCPGYTFVAWTNMFGEAVTTIAGGMAGDLTLYASWKKDESGGLNPEGDVVETTVEDATDAEDAESKAKESIKVPADAAAAVTAAAYAEYFKYGVTDLGGGSFKVAITGIVETVEAGVAASAVERLTSATATAIEVPAGLYYSITPSTALPISGTAEKGLSTGGTVTIDKPGTTAGFYEIKVSATPIQ